MDSRPERSAPAPGAEHGLHLGPAAVELYGDLRLSPLLRRLLEQSAGLLGGLAGSISLVDAHSCRYTKAAERGASCGLGQTFPLDEGITGRVVTRRRPVVLARYSDVPAGHLPPRSPARGGAVVAVPIWWRGEVIGANVAFAGRQRSFTAREVDDLELLSQVSAAGIVFSGTDEPWLGRLRGTDAVVEPAVAPRLAPVAGAPLTVRERQVLELVAQGRTDRQVAELLFLAPKTVEKHVGSVLRKTGTTSRTAAVVRALDHGWLTGARADLA